MVVYLTFNDAPSGVFNSQVADVVNFLQDEGQPTRLVSFVSMRGFSEARKKIKKQCAKAIVLPMFPGVKNWRMNLPVLIGLLLFLRPRVVMARGVFATFLARRARLQLRYFRVIFDARGAYHAEFEEYRLIDDPALIARVKKLEKKAISRSDGQLAVSKALIRYWQEQYGIDTSTTARVVPCTLHRQHEKPLLSDDERLAQRAQLGIEPENTLLVYSGSSAGWQSLEGLFAWLAEQMETQSHLRLLLLTPMVELKATKLERFADRVITRWVSPDKVHELLSLGDYGLLIRKPSTTNHVASPTKFAEYLSAGLKVIISRGLGDFSDFTRQHQCGHVLGEGSIPSFSPLNHSERADSHKLAMDHFTKKQFREAYSRLLA